MKIQSFTQGKTPKRNEDSFGSNENTVVLADGATDKSGKTYDGKTGGEIISNFVLEKTLESELNGVELVNFLTQEVENLYKEINPEALQDDALKFCSTLVCVRANEEMITVTQVGDSSFRVNGSDLYKNDKLIDQLNAEARSLYIEKTGDIAGARDYIKPLLKNQYQYQNNPTSPLGYSGIDGTSVPEKFIKVFEFPLSKSSQIELISDGYFSIPDEVSVDAYEAEYERVEREDPDKYKLFKSTKSKDDRTVVIIDF